MTAPADDFLLPYKALLFDLDDTLWATFENNKASLKQLYENEGWSIYYPTFEAYFAVYYPHQEQLWDDYRKGYIGKEQLISDRLRYPLSPFVSLTKGEAQRLNEQFAACVRQQTAVTPHAVEVLRMLHRHYAICIVSNGFEHVQYAKIQGSGLADHIDEMVLVDHVGTPKPDPAFFDYACRRIGVQRSAAAVIGDSWPSDIAGAMNCGMDAIWYNRWQEEMPPYDAAVHSIKEIRDLRQLLPILLPHATKFL